MHVLLVYILQVVCSHAVGVPPTGGLNAEMKGFLPIHCIHQLIKMRNFRKYNISIKVRTTAGFVQECRYSWTIKVTVVVVI